MDAWTTAIRTRCFPSAKDELLLHLAHKLHRFVVLVMCESRPIQWLLYTILASI